MTPRSAMIQSTRVLARIATRSWLPTPSVVRPAAIALARSATCDQVTHAIPSSGVGYPKAFFSGVAATRCRNMSGIDRYGTSKVMVGVTLRKHARDHRHAFDAVTAGYGSGDRLTRVPSGSCYWGGRPL